MAKWTSYFKFVTPTPSATKMTDSQEMADAGAYNNYTWYQRLIQGSASRMTRYREYDLMDNDVEISIALDTLAEEMTGNNTKLKEPIDIDVLSEDEENIESSAVMTVKAAARRWCQIHDFGTRLYNISRVLVKYGDVFFRKKPNPFTKWEYINPKNVVAAIVDADDATKVIAWQIKKDINQPKSGYGGLPIGAKKDSQLDTEIVDAREIVRFTLNDDMSDTAPFGESVLRPVYRSFKQKELLEDAIIIYRVQRAPERRVFYIDVGKMPPQRVKQYLETIKNEIKQKKIPTMNGGQTEIDSVYNPQSMCLALDTEIPLLDGRNLTLKELIDEFDEGKENWVYSIDPNTGQIVPGIISWAGITRRNAETIKLVFDNGDELVCTPDHKIPVQGKGFVEAKDITPNDSLFPFRTQLANINQSTDKSDKLYQQIYNPATKGWHFTHHLVANYMKSINCHQEFTYKDKYLESDKSLIHHISSNLLDNSPNNLAFMNYHDHILYHSNHQEAVFVPELFKRFEELVAPNIKTLTFKQMLEILNSDEAFMALYQEANKPLPNKKYKLKTDTFHQKMFLKFIKTFGYKNWRDYRQHKKQHCVDVENVMSHTDPNSEIDIHLLQHTIDLISKVSIHGFAIINHLKSDQKAWNTFKNLYQQVMGRETMIPHIGLLEQVAKIFNYTSFKHLVQESTNFNHRVVRIESGPVQDTGTLTIDAEEKYHNYHTFATKSIFVRNSEDFFFSVRPDGRGSRVETLPGGAGLGELSDLEYFQKKVWRGLKVPSSYLAESQEGGGIFNDGKVGVAYIQELRFALYIMRLQSHIEKVLDEEFKKFLKQAKIFIDDSMYRLVLPEPSNFGKYRQLELDSQLLSSYGTADGIQYLSKRFILERYLQLTDEEIIRNERMKREELGLDPDGGKEDYQTLYGEGGTEGFGGGLAGGGLGGGLGGMEMGMEAGAEGMEPEMSPEENPELSPEGEQPTE